MYFNLVCTLNHILFLKFQTSYLSLVKNFCNISMHVPCVMHLHEDGHLSDQNKYEVYGMYNTLSHTYGKLLVLISHYLVFLQSYKLAVV